MPVSLRPAAQDDLLAIVAYIAEDNPVAAYDVDAEIHRQIAILNVQPNIGRKGRVKGTKELVFQGLPYIAPYRVNGIDVEILRVLHSSQAWPV
jgi:plasmid stabilization system protein ParE